MSKQVVIVAGTRPEVIKMAPVYFALRRSERLRPVMLSTGQHRQMLDQAFGAFGIVPDHDLGLMQPGQALPDLTARALVAVADFLRRERPAAVLVQGDTTTVLSAAIAAFYERVPVGHVEAGLRTYDFEAPWPEEMNRRLADPIARWCFAPTELSRANLMGERVPAERVHVTGNTVIDALLWMRERVRAVDAEQVAARLGIPASFAERHLQPEGAPWVLVTGHRRESFGAGFEQICHAIRGIAEDHPELGVLYPVHLNPNVREPVARLLGTHPRIALVEPASYEDFIWLMDSCKFVVSDSGGVQEEAPSLGKPVLVMRETTERPEGLEAGTCTLVGTDPGRIRAEVSRLLLDRDEYARRSGLRNPYGDGQAAERIRAVLEREL